MYKTPLNYLLSSLVVWFLILKNVKADKTSFDCPMRQLALEYAASIQPYLFTEQLQEIADALNGSPEKTPNCTVVIDTIPGINNRLKKRTSKSWDDINNNEYGNIYVDIKKGDDSNIGSLQFPLKSLQIAIEKSRNYGINTLKKIIIREGRYYIDKTLILTSMDSNLIITNYNNEKVEMSGAIPLNNLSWNLYKKNSNNINIYSTNVNETLLLNNKTDITGLRINGSRAIRARYPNDNPETDGFGSNLQALEWLPPKQPIEPQFNFEPDNFPQRNDYANQYFQVYRLGLGGVCDNFEPSAGYWCSSNTQGGGAFTYRIPTGFVYNKSDLPNAPYSNPEGAIIQTWRPGHWSSWMFEIDQYSANTQTFTFKRGGFQGARGDDTGDEYFVENIFEELDYETEWFFNRTTNILYYHNNKTGEPSPEDKFEITNLKVLLFLNGNKSNPIRNVVIRGITFRDTAYTYMDPHGMPSGGDWALQRTGCITMQGTFNVTVEYNTFTRLDGNAVMVSGYNRNLTVFRNEFVWQGDSAIALWGNTNGFTFPRTDLGLDISYGYDGTNGEQPRYSYIIENYVHEVGIFEKQSSFYFQAKSCQNYLMRNIFYNGPRAGINFNDGFGGDNHILENLLFNTCRESGDHGPFNSWDRQVYYTDVNGTNSTNKLYDHIHNNFFIDNYNGQEGIDNDDGSQYYRTFSNFFVYGGNGMKNDFGGHDNHHFNNLYAYSGEACFQDNTEQLAGHNDYFYNNSCIIYNNVTNYGSFLCSDIPQSEWPILGNNSIYTPYGAQGFVGLCNIPEAQFQQTYKNDLGTTVSNIPSDDYVLNLARSLLNL